MQERTALVTQIAKAFAGSEATDHAPPSDEACRQADEALSRVEIYLGVDIEQAKDILNRVLEDVS